MEPIHDGFQKESPIPGCHFQFPCPMLNFRRLFGIILFTRSFLFSFSQFHRVFTQQIAAIFSQPNYLHEVYLGSTPPPKKKQGCNRHHQDYLHHSEITWLRILNCAIYRHANDPPITLYLRWLCHLQTGGMGHFHLFVSIRTPFWPNSNFFCDTVILVAPGCGIILGMFLMYMAKA